MKKDCGTDFQMRIGINSGQVIVGTTVDDLRMGCSAVGDTTNWAARMESMARPRLHPNIDERFLRRWKIFC